MSKFEWAQDRQRMVDIRSITSNDHQGLAKAPVVAEYLSTTVANLARLRWEGTGPAYVRLGRSIRYRWSDVDEWVESNLNATGGVQ